MPTLKKAAETPAAAPAAVQQPVAPEAAQRLADGPGELGERQHARGGGYAVTPSRGQEQHKLGQRGELDHAEKEGREPPSSRSRGSAARRQSRT